MSIQKYTHAVARLTVDGKQYKGTAALTKPTTTMPEYEYEYEAAKKGLEVLKPTGWIIVSPVFEVGDSEVLDANLEIGVILEDGKEVYQKPVPVQVIQA